MISLRAMISLVVMFLAQIAFASGTVSLKGKVESFSPDMFELSDGRDVYRISRKKIFEFDNMKLAKIKTGSKVEMDVPFEAIVSVKHIKK